MRCVLVLSKSDLSRDHRVRRQIKLLKDSGEIKIVTFALNSSGMEDAFIKMEPQGTNFIRKVLLAFVLLFRFYRLLRKLQEHQFSNEKIEIRKHKPNLVIVNDINSIPFGWGVAEKIVVDAHEYTPGQYNSFKYRFFFKGYMEYIARYYFQKVDAVYTVCESIASLYEAISGIRPKLFRNIPYFHDLNPIPFKNTIRIVHHGGANQNRQIEQMIFVADYLPPGYFLTFYLVPGDKEYYNYLISLADQRNNVEILPPLQSDDVIGETNHFDIGLYLLEPENINQNFALPNKLFEFIQSRLCVAVSPGIEMAEVIKEHDIGIMPKENTAKEMADAISRLSRDDIERYKRNSHTAATLLCFENESIEFSKNVRKLIFESNE